eukprot:CAMPEP_0198251112 /NCGR_PEP_ID=MMETSP1447-20131203/2057_1 /TAXON_ID=420782 /ORGANISM="Chaetoceros dichaeta, Strain CCMP1751" /LENGTH=428 /DNA_ID=CAMNT_0043936063 /DNA_START=64 /DNA_END=1351 /DNA_ORIENTATION=-
METAKSSELVETANSNNDSIRNQFSKTIEECYSGVDDGPVLGSGVSGQVRKITHRTRGNSYAVKVLDISCIKTEAQMEQLRDEIDIMCELDHPNVVSLEEVYETDTKVCLVEELCSGGELFDQLEEQPLYRYPEEKCVELVRQIATAVAYIHSKGIVHRDLKLENFLFESTDKDSPLKIIDFGLSKHFAFNEAQTDTVGTPYTVAPEVIRGRYTANCDVWGIGVIAYMLLCGDPPFGGCGGPETPLEIRERILAGNVVFGPNPIWDSVSEGAKDFVRSLLVTDRSLRPSSVQCLNLPWLRQKNTGSDCGNESDDANAAKDDDSNVFNNDDDKRNDGDSDQPRESLEVDWRYDNSFLTNVVKKEKDDDDGNVINNDDDRRNDGNRDQLKGSIELDEAYYSCSPDERSFFTNDSPKKKKNSVFDDVSGNL